MSGEALRLRATPTKIPWESGGNPAQTLTYSDTQHLKLFIQIDPTCGVSCFGLDFLVNQLVSNPRSIANWRTLSVVLCIKYF